MEKKKFLALLTWLAASACYSSERVPIPVQPPRVLVGLEFIGVHKLDFPDGFVSGAKMILPDGRVVIQDRRDASLFVFGAAGQPTEQLSAPPVSGGRGARRRVKWLIEGEHGEFLGSSFTLAPRSLQYAHFAPSGSRGVLDLGFPMLRKKPNEAGWWGSAVRSNGVQSLDANFKPQSSILHEPDQWLDQYGSVTDMELSPSGTLAVLHSVYWDNGYSSVRHAATLLYMLGPRGRLVAEWSLAPALPGAFEVQFDGRNALIMGGNPDVVSVDTETGLWGRIEIPRVNPPPNAYSLTFVHGGREIWATANHRENMNVVLRFAPLYGRHDPGKQLASRSQINTALFPGFVPGVPLPLRRSGHYGLKERVKAPTGP